MITMFWLAAAMICIRVIRAWLVSLILAIWFTVIRLAVWQLPIAYTILEKPNPLAVAAEIVKGYHAEFALDETEINALFGMIALRLCMSVCLAAHQQAQRPDDEYLAISQAPIRQTLPKLAEIHPRFAEAVFRHACGLEPVRKD